MINLGQFCINVVDLEKSIAFYCDGLGLKLDQRIEMPGLKEAILTGDNGEGALQLAQQLDRESDISHGDGFWKFYLNSDNCRELYKKAIELGAEPMQEPMELEQWNVVIAFFKDLDGYTVEIVEQR